jgi:1-acyl-sn-glycerol-3-phosphate acyltransferase
MQTQNSLKLSTRILNFSLRNITEVICDVDAKDLSKIPEQGPLIVFVNHINFLEVPVVASRLENRQISVIAKEETWKNPALAFLFDSWNGIPIKRGALDREAIQRSLEAIEKGNILVVAPEGTRSKDGKLKQGMPGIVLLALKAHVPLLPLVYYGGEKFWDNISRFQRTKFTIKVGKKFILKEYPRNPDKLTRQLLTDEFMAELAKLLPHSYRGYYKHISIEPSPYFDYLD